MNIFDHFPQESTCPECKTSNDEMCILVPIPGTAEGGLVETRPVHVRCVIAVGREAISERLKQPVKEEN